MSCDRQEKDNYLTRTTIAISTIILPLGNARSVFNVHVSIKFKFKIKQQD